MGNRRQTFKKFDTLVDGHVQHIADRFAFVADLQGFAVIAFSVARIAMDIYIGQEVHLNQLQPATLTTFATASLHIKREAPGFVAANLGFGQLCKQRTDIGENAGISYRVRAGRTAQRRLVDLHHFIDMLKSFNPLVRQRIF